jgi:hypothetical protein
MFAFATFAQNWLLMGCAAVMIMATTVELRRRVRDSETVANWVYDRGQCGRCGYDLTYVDRPTQCPECGWTVPSDDVRAQRADWAMWWKCWTIEYLEHPKKKLAMVSGFGLAFTAMCVWGVIYGFHVSAVLGAFMAATFAINIVRVSTYLRRESRDRKAES